MITPVSLKDIEESIARSDENLTALQKVREHACAGTGEIVRTEAGEWVLIGASYEGKLSDLTIRAGGHVEIKNSYRTTGRTRGRTKPLVAERKSLRR